MADKLESEELLLQISQKLNVLISLYLKSAAEVDFAIKGTRNQGVGDVARYLSKMGLNAKDVAEITGSPLPSIRTLLTPSRKK